MLLLPKDNVMRLPILGPLLVSLVVLDALLIFDLASGGERVQQVLVEISHLFGA